MATSSTSTSSPTSSTSPPTLVPTVLISENNSRLWVIKNYCPIDLYDFLNKLNFQIEPEIVVFGKVGHQRRDIIFYSDTSIGYRYSGQMIASTKLTGTPEGEFLLNLLNQVNKSLGTSFNGLLINRYRDGTKSIGAHSDSEASLDKKNKAVASLSFGAERKFRIHNKATEEIVMDISTEQGMLLVMDGEFQTHFKHSIVPQKLIEKGRISVTFRHHLE